LSGVAIHLRSAHARGGRETIPRLMHHGGVVRGERASMPGSLPSHIAALIAPGALPSSPSGAELVQTHGSYVLLTNDRAYKLKKPLDLGFLDYSTLAKRRAACEAEVRLNRRLSSDVYHGVEPVVRAGAGYRLQASAAGEIVDYAVVM